MRVPMPINIMSTKRNGVRPRRVQTAEGELEVQMPQLRDTADRFVSRLQGGAGRYSPLHGVVLLAVVG
jgi:hypothetical protein